MDNCVHEKAAKEVFTEADMASAWMKIQIKTGWCFWQMEKYSTTQTMENYALNKLFGKLQGGVFPVENHHAHQHLLTGKSKAISICRLSRFKVKSGSMIEYQGLQYLLDIFTSILSCSGSLSCTFPLGKATGSRVMTPKLGPICFRGTARGKWDQPQISQQGCHVWSNLLPQPLASATHLLAKAAGGSEYDGLLCWPLDWNSPCLLACRV